MKSKLLLTILLLAAQAAATTVTATVKDANNYPYVGTVSAYLFTSGPPKVGAVAVNSSIGPFTMSGAFSISLVDTSTIVPAGSVWLFTICGATVALPPDVPSRTLCFNVGPMAITGVSLDISSTVNAVAPRLGPSFPSVTAPWDIVSGGFKGSLTHNNTADRAYTFPDRTGTIATLNGDQAFTGNNTIGGIVNGAVNAAKQSGADACAQIHNALLAVPNNGIVEATDPSLASTDCAANSTPDPFIGVTKAVKVKLGSMLNTNRTWFLGRGSNQYLECTSPSAGLNQTGGNPSIWGQDRVIALDWNEPVDGAGLPPHSTFGSPINETAITGNIAVGDTLFTSTALPPAGVVTGAWVQVYTKESVLADVIAFDMAQVASVVGNTVNVVRPFRTAFTENGGTPGTNNFYLVLSQTSPTENVGVSGCTIKAVDLGAPAPGIAVMRVRNARVEHNVVQIINGQPIYDYRSVGAHFIDNKFKGDSGIQESEFAESVETVIDDLTCENEGTTAAFNCGVTFDFGFGHFRASNIHLDGGASSAGAYGALYGVHDGVLSNLTAGYSSGGVGFLSLGSKNLTLTTSRFLGAGGASTGIKFNDYVSAAVTLTSALNIIAFNRVDGYNTTYDVPNDTDLLVRDNTAGSFLFIHGLVGLERPEPSGMCSAAQDSFWPDSAAQRFKMCNHNGTRQFVAGTLTGSDAAVDLASVNSGACTVERAVAITGAAFGNTVQVSAGTALEAGTSLVGKISSAGNIKWQFCNLSGGAVDRASDTYTIQVIQ